MTSPLPRQAALAVLIVLQLIMLMALFAGVAPHPPAAITPFAMAPFLAASMGIASAAILLARLDGTAPKALAALAVLCAMVSFGPHKYFDPAFGAIWPAVLTAQGAAIAVIKSLLPARAPVAQTA